MCLLTEAIKVERKKFQNLEYHQQRFDDARMKLFGLDDQIQLEEVLQLPGNITDATYKCKIVYSHKIQSVCFTLYEKHLPNSIKLVYDNTIDYSFKYDNRRNLETLIENSGADEILIVKNGMVTDTSRSNIVLAKGNKLITPATFLLEGTKRKNMLENNLIGEEAVSVDALFKYEKLFIINAMIDLEDQPGFPVQEIKQ